MVGRLTLAIFIFSYKKMIEEEVTRGGRLRPSPKMQATGSKIVVTIGIDDYQHLTPLRNAVNDATGVQRMFEEKLGYITLPDASLFNKQATQQAINELIKDRLREELEPDDTLVLFFAGHGATRDDERGGSVGFLAPVEADKWSSYLRIDELLDEIGRLPPLHILVIIDTCFSGFALGGSFARQVKAGESGRAATRRVLTSARADQLASDGKPQTHSPFTTILLNAFASADEEAETSDPVPAYLQADFDRDGRINLIELGAFVQFEFRKAFQKRQMPDFGTFHHDERGEFVLTTYSDPYQPTDPKMLAILFDVQRWLHEGGNPAYLYRGEQLKQARAWQAQKEQQIDIRNEITTFLNSSVQWQWLRRLAVFVSAIVVIGTFYFVGNGIHRQQLKRWARVESAEFPTATIPLGADQTPILVEAFRLDKQEVSAEQYHLCYRAGHCDIPAGQPNYADTTLTTEAAALPMVDVNAFNARDYCVWQGGHLPTAAEWEYAVRGVNYRSWPWGEDEPANRYTNIYIFNIADPTPPIGRLAAVQDENYVGGVSAEGIWHLIGNAREWTRTIVPNCPHDRFGRFKHAYQCDTWDSTDDSVASLFAIGRSYSDDLVPEDAPHLANALNISSDGYASDLGFRCAYNY